MSLLASTFRLIERTYQAPAGIGDPARYIIGNEGYRLLASRHEIAAEMDGAPEPPPHLSPPGPRVLIRPQAGSTALSIYFPDDLIRRLEADPPTRSLHDRNVDDFAAFIEEIDHFSAIAHGLASGRALHLLELEIRANISKSLVLSHFVGRLSGRPHLDPVQRLWVRHHLFEKHEFSDERRAIRRRYLDARRLAVRLLDRLERMTRPQRVAELRRWSRLPAQEKVRELLAL